MSVLDFIIPRIPVRQIPGMFRLALLGALIAGTYGIIHDQVTYTLSNEYFTKFKFQQFHHIDFGFPVRIHVAEIGFLATWWVGFFSGWFISRQATPSYSAGPATNHVLRGFAIILGCAFLGGLFGFVLGYFTLTGSNLNDWADWQLVNGVVDLRNFALVGYIHDFGYIGVLIGFITAIFYVRNSKPVPV